MQSVALSELSYVGLGVTCQLHHKNLGACWDRGAPYCYSFLYQAAQSLYCSFERQRPISCWVTAGIHCGSRKGLSSHSGQRERQIQWASRFPASSGHVSDHIRYCLSLSSNQTAAVQAFVTWRGALHPCSYLI